MPGWNHQTLQCDFSFNIYTCHMCLKSGLQIKPLAYTLAPFPQFISEFDIPDEFLHAENNMRRLKIRRCFLGYCY